MSDPIKSDIFRMVLEPDARATRASKIDSNHVEDWHVDYEEGQLAVDVMENADEIIVVSTMAGAKTEEITVYIHNDLLTIRGLRVPPFDNQSGLQYVYQECFWGKFSRTIVLPTDVQGDAAQAEYKNGILSIYMPKRQVNAQVPIMIVEE